jgi:hypothetical protein
MPTRRDLKEHARHELREYAITAAYLFVWLSALLLYEDAIRGEEGLAALPIGVAATKALILGKFVLLGQTFGAGTRVAAPTLVHRIAWRSLALLIVLAVLLVIEEFVVGLLHGHKAAEVLAELTAQSPEHAARALLMLLMLVPFVAAKQISLALGPGELRRLLTNAPD